MKQIMLHLSNKSKTTLGFNFNCKCFSGIQIVQGFFEEKFD